MQRFLLKEGLASFPPATVARLPSKILQLQQTSPMVQARATPFGVVPVLCCHSDVLSPVLRVLSGKQLNSTILRCSTVLVLVLLWLDTPLAAPPPLKVLNAIPLWLALLLICCFLISFSAWDCLPLHATCRRLCCHVAVTCPVPSWCTCG